MIRCLAAVLSLAVPATAGDFSLQAPIVCDLADDCYVQQFVDRDPGPAVQDFLCGTLSYDGHKGTDFALPTLKRMRQGTSVVAAAPGTVTAIRDGMPDSGYAPDTVGLIEGRECGNGAVIRHQDGWETQYCHLRQGSLRVAKGEEVGRGQTIGLVGMSGRSQFPHVHLTVRKDGVMVDPFAPKTQACNETVTETLWQNLPPIRHAGIITLGLSADVPEFETIKAGAVPPPDTLSDAVVIYVSLFGPRAGDIVALDLFGPDGQIAASDIEIFKDQAMSFRAIGRKRRGDTWPPGTYSGSATLWRSGKALERRELAVDLR